MTVRKEIVTDASVFLAVLLNEPVRTEVESLTAGAKLAAPGCLGWEIGNALYGALKRKRLTVNEAVSAYHAFQHIPVRELDVDLAVAIRLSAKHGIPAYDAYYLQCALAGRHPVLTLDVRMGKVAIQLGLTSLWGG